jgi:hypothetical protein
MEIEAGKAGTCVSSIVAFEKRTILGEVATTLIYHLFT